MGRANADFLAIVVEEVPKHTRRATGECAVNAEDGGRRRLRSHRFWFQKLAERDRGVDQRRQCGFYRVRVRSPNIARREDFSGGYASDVAAKCLKRKRNEVTVVDVNDDLLRDLAI